MFFEKESKENEMKEKIFQKEIKGRKFLSLYQKRKFLVFFFIL